MSSFYRSKKKKRSNDNDDSKGNHSNGNPVKHSKQDNGCKYTVSIAIPSSLIQNAQTRELKTWLVGQIARTLVLFEVDEVIVYVDTVVEASKGASGLKNVTDQDHAVSSELFNTPAVFITRLLQYLETPPYLRKLLFPLQYDLKFAGLLPPLDIPHHTRRDENSMFREGVVLDIDKNDSSSDKVDVGLNHPISINRTLTPNVRVTVQILNDKKAKVVSPSTPRTDYGKYWGYSTRISTTLANVFNECPYEKYDLKIGLGDKGLKLFDNEKSSNNDDADNKFTLPIFKHALLVFGIGKDLDTVIANDETMTSNIFDMKLDIFPNGGTRTIRTEEALIIALSRLQPLYKNINK